MAATIRPYAKDDLDACRALWIELTHWHRTIYENDAIGGDDPGAQFDEHLGHVGPGNLWVAEDDGRVVGLAGLIVEEREGEIEPVVVRADHRGHGIGRRLAETVIDAARARGLRRIKVRPVARNERAVRFFRSLGLDVVAHVELFTDLVPRPDVTWTRGPTIGGAPFRC